MKDGDIDYSKYGLAELREAEGRIDSQNYPKNHANLLVALSKHAKESESVDPRPDKPETEKFNWFFPIPIETPDQIKKSLNVGATACALITIVTILITSYAVFKEPVLGLDAWTFGDAALFAICGYGVFRGSRVAAIVAVILFVLARYFMYVDEGQFPSVFSIFLFLMLVTGLRGTFAHNRSRAIPEAASGQDAD